MRSTNVNQTSGSAEPLAKNAAVLPSDDNTSNNTDFTLCEALADPAKYASFWENLRTFADDDPIVQEWLTFKHKSEPQENEQTSGDSSEDKTETEISEQIPSILR